MYKSRITREHRTAFLLLVDCSGSMEEETFLYGERLKKKEGVSLIVNMFLEELINRSRREEGVVDYFDICVIGYGDDRVSMLLSDETHPFVTVSELSQLHTRSHRFTISREMPGGRHTTFELEQRCWVEPRSKGSTPMGLALKTAHPVLEKWCAAAKNKDSFPPSLINITDGEASDADAGQLLEYAQRIRALHTNDGEALLFNIHLASGGEGGGEAVNFPSAISELPETRYARLLYEISSLIPSCYDDMLLEYIRGGIPPFRGVCYNCPPDKLFGMLKIGSASAELML